MLALTRPESGFSLRMALRLWTIAVFGVIMSFGTGCRCGNDDGNPGGGGGGGGTPPPPSPGTLRFLSTSTNVNVIEYTATVTIEVERVSGSSGIVSVDVLLTPTGAVEGTDYTTNPATVGGVVTLTWGDTETGIKSFDITTVDDLVDDEGEYITLTLQNPQGTPAPTTSFPTSGQVYIWQDWIPYSGNPVVQYNTTNPGAWNGSLVAAPCVIQDPATVPPSNPTYWLYMMGNGGPNLRTVGRYQSSDGTTWQNGQPTDIIEGGTFYESYVDDPWVIWDPNVSRFKLWFTADGSSGRVVVYAESTDGFFWTTLQQPQPITFTNAAETWEALFIHGVSVILRPNGDYWMWYTGVDAGGVESIGFATSTNGGSTWTRDTARNPVLTGSGVGGSFDEISVSTPAVMLDGQNWRLWYMGYNGNVNFNTEVGYAADLTTGATGIPTWTRFAGNPVVVIGPSGLWNDNSIAWPTGFRIADQMLLYYEGWPDPSSSLIQIGVARVPQ